MILLYFTSIDRDHQLRHFNCQLYQLETVLDTLNLIAVAGSTLLTVYILEDGKRTNLSPQAFDGSDLLKPIRDLQHQWEALLAQPRDATPVYTNLSHIEMVLQRIDQFESRMAESDLTIRKFEKLIIQTQQQVQDSSAKTRLIDSYRLSISQQQAYITQAQANRDKWLQKLAQSKKHPDTLW